MSPARTYIISERLHLYPCEHRDTALALKLNVEGYPSSADHLVFPKGYTCIPVFTGIQL